MNPSTAQATVLVDALILFGVEDAVLAPGSRSAPLAFALAAAERAGRIRLHVRIDERSAGFLALGLAKASGLPVPVVTTSGTAVANLFPAVVEASYAGIPLIVLSADRPAALRGVGAPQTIDQIKIFGDHVRNFTEVGTAAAAPGQVAYWRSLITRVAAIATDPADPGPVHLNLPFAEPLVPDGEPDFVEPLDNRAHGQSWFSPFSPTPSDVALEEVLAGMGLDRIPEKGLVVVGDIPDVGWDGGRKMAYLADVCDWPIIAEPSAGMHRAPTWLPAGPLLVGAVDWLDRHRPELVISVGKVGLTREVAAMLRQVPHHLVIDRTARWSDPSRTASAVIIGSIPMPPQRLTNAVGTRIVGPESSWLARWRAANETVLAVRDEFLADAEFSGLQVASEVWSTMPDEGLLFLGPSWPIRQAYLTASPRAGLRVLANRGANGIDGVISTAWGAAIAHQRDLGGPSVALVGDITYLHDTNGLLAGVGEDRPPLTIVVIDNDGGGIFSGLEQGAPAFETDFERVFGTPHHLNLVARARLSGVPARQVTDLDELRDALADRPPGVSVVVAEVTERSGEAALIAELRATISAALASDR